jgi:hypothetical protein
MNNNNNNNIIIIVIFITMYDVSVNIFFTNISLFHTLAKQIDTVTRSVLIHCAMNSNTAGAEHCASLQTK